ncbi:unnamed protein product, partial [Effrenium voratum]
VKLGLFDKKVLDDQWYRNIKDLWTGPGTHVGMLADDYWPPFQKGTVVGIDVDMDDGSLAFWGNGQFLGVVKDNEGKPVNLKGKKVVPAMSVYGRNTGAVKQNTIMEAPAFCPEVDHVWMTVSPSRGDLGYPRAASPALGSPTLSPLSPFARGGSPVAYFRHTLSPTSSPFAGLRPPLRGIPPVVLQRRAASPLPAIPVRSVSPPRQPRSLSPQAVPGFCHMPHTQLREAPVGSRFLVPRSAWQAPQACPVRK